jgi:ubiquinone/menaquinone biosynthesis C-methylase UbiE
MSKTKVEKHFDEVAGNYDFYKEKNSFYYDNLKKLLKSLIPVNKNVLEVGCGTGDLLASLNPQKGYGMDISGEMIVIAKAKHKSQKKLFFSTLLPNEEFDYIFMSDVIEHLEKPEKTFKEISKLMNDKSKFIVTMANPFWEPFLMLAEKMKLKMPEGPHKRVAFNDLKLMINDLGMKVVKHDYKLLIPVRVPFITNFANKYLEKPFRKLCFVEYFVIVKV